MNCKHCHHPINSCNHKEMGDCAFRSTHSSPLKASAMSLIESVDEEFMEPLILDCDCISCRKRRRFDAALADLRNKVVEIDECEKRP